MTHPSGGAAPSLYRTLILSSTHGARCVSLLTKLCGFGRGGRLVQSQLIDRLICVFTQSPSISWTLMTPTHACKWCRLQQRPFVWRMHATAFEHAPVTCIGATSTGACACRVQQGSRWRRRAPPSSSTRRTASTCRGRQQNSAGHFKSMSRQALGGRSDGYKPTMTLQQTGFRSFLASMLTFLGCQVCVLAWRCTDACCFCLAADRGPDCATAVGR